MAAPRIIERDFGLNKVLDKFRDVKGYVGRAGYPMALEGPSTPSGISVGEYMTLNNDGTATIPSRPFMDVAFQNNNDKYNRMVDEIAAALADPGAGASPRQAIAALVIEAANDIKRTITDLREPANSEATIFRKGFDNPLIETGTARSAVSWTVTKGGGS